MPDASAPTYRVKHVFRTVQGEGFWTGQPAVFVVDPETATVDLRPVDIARFDLATVTVEEGLGGGDVVVTAGVQALRPGQEVRLLGAAP